MMKRTMKLALSVGFATAALVASAPEALAVDWVIKSPSAHPTYRAELEPHLNFILYGAGFGRGHYSRNFGNAEIGGGFRASIELGGPLFIPSILNTIAISFGIDTNSCRYGCRHDAEIWSPVALQWNFFLTRKWSVFAEFGGIVRSDGFFNNMWIDPTVWLGTRLHFNDKVALTGRFGTHWLGVGVSFFVGS